MESATIAAQGYRFRVPYGTLLCVSDKPIHGELKLPGQANRFYEEAIASHLRVGIETCELLRQEGPKLHSRSEEQTSELQSLMRISYAVFCLKQKQAKTRH